jgi:uncharacterized protein DUF5666
MNRLILATTRTSLLGLSLTLAVSACGHKPDTSQDTTQVAQTSQPTDANAPLLLRGTVTSVSANQLVLKSDTGTITVPITQPFHLYTRESSDLSHVKENSFIGVTTVKQPDGSERATEIHVFPEELRGLGEGSRMMGPDTTSNRSRMTNGNVSQSRMTNGTASQSRMSNGNVSSTNGTSLVVQYAGGSQNVTVPPKTPVTELKLSSKNIAAGDQVVVMAKKNPDGSLTADKAVSTKR